MKKKYSSLEYDIKTTCCYSKNVKKYFKNVKDKIY